MHAPEPLYKARVFPIPRLHLIERKRIRVRFVRGMVILSRSKDDHLVASRTPRRTKSAGLPEYNCSATLRGFCMRTHLVVHILPHEGRSLPAQLSHTQVILGRESSAHFWLE